MKQLVMALALISVWTAEAALTLIAPKEGEKVPQLWQNVKDFLDLPREARKENAYKISKKEKNQFKQSRGAKPVEFAWTGDTNAVYTLTVKRLPQSQPEETKSAARQSYVEQKAAARERRRLERAVEQAEAEVTRLEQAIAELEAQLADGAADLNLYTRHADLTRDLKAAMQAWEDAAEQL